jgi:predicted phosphodiesterase
MRVAVLNDIHAMPWALEAVLAEVDADEIVFGGDFIGGPCPRETLELVRSTGGVCIRGNAERAPSERDTALLGVEDVAWLQALPLTATLDRVLYCHATPTDDEPMTTAITPDDAIAELFAGIEGTVVIGHTHHQFDRRVGALRVVNAGSVGMAYESRVAAYWALVVDGEPELRRTELDVEGLTAAILATDWPTAGEFVAENVRVAVDRDEAIGYFESRR